MARTGMQWALAVFGIGVFCEIVQGKIYNAGVRYTVVLNVYSGRENPVCIVDEDNQLYDDISSMLNDDPPTPLDDDLGYAGFVIEASNAMGQKVWKTIGRNTNINLESSLLSACQSTKGLSLEVVNEVNAGISGQYRKKRGDINKDNYMKQRIYRKKRNSDVCSTKFNPTRWNTEEVQPYNNCYNYATNRITYTFAQPGRYSGDMYKNITSSELLRGSLLDGLTQLSGPNAGNECLVALFIWPGQDYHFLREDKLDNGYWSQKNGGTIARNTDDSGYLIPDPLSANLGPYTTFVSWLGVGPNVGVY